MCGIAGIINLNGQGSFQAKPLQQMTNQMFHRGPDGEGFFLVGEQGGQTAFWGDDTLQDIRLDSGLVGQPKAHIQTAFETKTHVALGHRRLSIVDLSVHGHQPMPTYDKRYWVVFNGEIYNYKEIALELRAEGVHFQGQSDTEVLLYAYATWGEECLHRFNGDFAFAIWDNKKKHLFCARDRIGIKPFYYTVQDNQFIFASDIKTIIASGLYTAKVDLEGLYFAMAFGMSPRPLTAFAGISALEQGHWLKVDLSGHIQKQEYWKIPVGTQNKRMSESEAIELVDFQLTEAVCRRLNADVPIGTFMSGGIDSTTISSIASRLHPGIKAFTLGYENTVPELDEVPQAEATARNCDMQHIVSRVFAEDTLEGLPSWMRAYEEPYYSLAVNHVISKLVKKNGVTVVLNGLGGDELFAGYSYYKYAKYWPVASKLFPIIEGVSSFFGGRGKMLSRIASVQSLGQLHTVLFQHNTDRELQGLFKSPILQGINTPECLQTLYAKDIEFEDPIEAISYMDLMNYVGNHHVHRVDQFTMLNSVEGRFPFLDHQLIEAAYQIPSKWKLQKNVHKHVLREVAKEYIDPSCLSMEKKGFGLPLKQWLQGPLQAIVKEKIESLKERELVNPAGVNNWVRSGVATKIWHLVALELWLEEFVD